MSIERNTLKISIEQVAQDLFPILKALGNPKRFSLLIVLLDGPCSFQKLLSHTHLQKTALANHLNHLVQVNLIQKPDYGYYDLTIDGTEYLRALYRTWKQSMTAQQKTLQSVQSRPMSSGFIKKLLHQE
nr:winged helix-turn-helix domain-containing protein [Candidatus Prometheoarchaeum syntrophicum]QEE16220.1 hypothetical protein DSAG12_02050 [Candidatus Prometheoarchaeum syntrophicum]